MKSSLDRQGGVHGGRIGKIAKASLAQEGVAFSTSGPACLASLKKFPSVLHISLAANYTRGTHFLQVGGYCHRQPRPAPDKISELHPFANAQGLASPNEHGLEKTAELVRPTAREVGNSQALVLHVCSNICLTYGSNADTGPVFSPGHNPSNIYFPTPWSFHLVSHTVLSPSLHM